ncbi:anaphase-promoting complex subunit 2 isoform X2 [Nymphaea colorata]|uniref:anaphase-promoting complex subunit 2 isoform X2 n=1 Tax=Nymphaea colorata TaxID=210225 RepID=UPI00129DC2EC|nr:anaphase-promoting complex subunit 2 isoform X2 [Nymphaea colorata]
MDLGAPESRLGALDNLGSDAINEIAQSWEGFCACLDVLLSGCGGPSVESEFTAYVKVLSRHGFASLIQQYILQAVEDRTTQDVLAASLEEICSLKKHQEKCLSFLGTVLSFHQDFPTSLKSSVVFQNNLLSKYQLMVAAVMLSTLPGHFPEFLHLYFKRRLEELIMIMMDDQDRSRTDIRFSTGKWFGSKSHGVDEMDVDDSNEAATCSSKNRLVRKFGKVVSNLRSLGFASMTEDAYASAIFLLLKTKVEDLAGDDYRAPVLNLIKEWIQAILLPFLSALLSYMGDVFDSNDGLSSRKSPLAFSPSFDGEGIACERLIRWKLRLEYFAYETLQDLRIAKLFDIIVDYPDSSPAIEDLKQCLENTGQHSKLIDSFISALRYRLLTAGASTNDILHQYISTIKALCRIDPTGVFLEAVSEPIRDYLRGRKDTIKCIVNMLTDGTGGGTNGSGGAGDSLLEELNRNVDNLEISDHDNDFNSDDKQAWADAQSWEPDPIEADPLKGVRNGRKVDILGMLVSIIGSKDQLVNQYHIMLAEKLLNKLDYDIDSEIRTLELLKIHFGESSMQKCEIMLNDLRDSKRTNSSIKEDLAKSSKKGTCEPENEVSMDLFDATIISTKFWPPFQVELESLCLPGSIDQLVKDYAQRFHELKTPRKLNWKKNLGVVKLELEFEDRSLEFKVSPLCAVVILKFQEQTSWTSGKLSDSIGVPVDVLNRAISFWISKGLIAESLGSGNNDNILTLIEDLGDANKNSLTTGRFGGLLAVEEEGESSMSLVEEQVKKEMTVYEKYVFGMLTNFGSMTLDRIHNTLKMFCMGDHPYDKSIHQLQNFLSGLVSVEKLELRDGTYLLKK